MNTKTDEAVAWRRTEAERIARDLDYPADLVEAHLIELERKGIIVMLEQLNAQT